MDDDADQASSSSLWRAKHNGGTGVVDKGPCLDSFSLFPRAELELELVGVLALVSSAMLSCLARHLLAAQRSSTDYMSSTTLSGVNSKQ